MTVISSFPIWTEPFSEAIRYFHENGGLFTLATGRDVRVLEYAFPQAPDTLSCPAILCNGVYMYDYGTGEFFDEMQMDKEEFLSVLAKVRQSFPEVGFRISSLRGFLCPYVSPFMRERSASFSSIILEEDLGAHMDIPWHKCVFVADENTIQRMIEFFSRMEFSSLVSVASSKTLVELLPIGSGKGGKIARLKELYPDRTVICVGDFFNDLDMMQVADVAACPANALDEIKAISSIHLCHHREGCIADLIYKLEHDPA